MSRIGAMVLEAMEADWIDFPDTQEWYDAQPCWKPAPTKQEQKKQDEYSDSKSLPF